MLWGGLNENYKNIVINVPKINNIRAYYNNIELSLNYILDNKNIIIWVLVGFLSLLVLCLWSVFYAFGRPIRPWTSIVYHTHYRYTRISCSQHHILGK